MSTLDLNFLSLYRINGQEWPVMPGLLALNPPRKIARGREQDRLIVYMTLAGSVGYSAAEYGEITAQIADRFYNTVGSITLALKTAVESLNTFLMERNSKGQYSVAALVLAALRGNSLYITQCGPTHAYWLMSGEARHFYDAGLAGKGLGLSEKPQMYFSQITLNPNDRVLFCAALPPNWDKSFADERGNPSLETTRRRLMAITDTNVSAVLFQAVEGSGAMNIAKAGPVGVGQAPVEGEKPSAEPAPKTESAPEPLPLLRPAASKKQSAPGKPLLTPEQRETIHKGVRLTALALARTIQASRRLTERASEGIQTMLPRLVPGEQDPNQRGIPNSWLAFLALALPILALTVGVLIYEQIGKPAIFDSYYQKAVDAVEAAKTEQDPTSLRTDWKSALDWLDIADDLYLVPERAEETRKLRQQAQKSLDQLNRTIRVQYRPAFNTTLRRMNITRMAATDVDLYLLDSETGGVIHGILNGPVYNTDPGFDSCKPGTYDGIEVGKLIDIIALPRSNASNASLIGIDGAANLLYCASEEKPKAASLQRPEKNLQSVTAIAYDANTLYLLDSLGRAVWIYFGTVDMQFPNQPHFFFQSQIPNGIENTIDMAVNGDDLYLLHQNSHLTTCTFSRIEASSTRCVDPVTLVDTRPGYESSEKLAGATFSQIAFTPPPDPAVALLEPYPYIQSIYRFSARALELQHEIAPPPNGQIPPPDHIVTAMAFSPNKVIFISVDGQVYFAVNVP